MYCLDSCFERSHFRFSLMRTTNLRLFHHRCLPHLQLSRDHRGMSRMCSRFFFSLLQFLHFCFSGMNEVKISFLLVFMLTIVFIPSNWSGILRTFSCLLNRLLSLVLLLICFLMSFGLDLAFFNSIEIIVLCVIRLFFVGHVFSLHSLCCAAAARACCCNASIASYFPASAEGTLFCR